MAEVVLTLLNASLSTLFDRMKSREVLDFLQGRKLTEGLLRKLKTAVLSVNAVLEDAEEKQLTRPFVKEWVDELKDVLYDAEDILDEIATEALRSKLDAKSRTGKVRNFISNFLNPFVNKVEQKIKEVLDRLDDLAKRKDFMGLQVGVGGKQYPERLTTSYVIESDTFGRDDDKKRVIDLLLSSDTERNEMFGVIAIVGMGGIGKTTLSQLVYNDSQVKQHFNLKIWFCVSEGFVEPNVQRSIIEATTLSACNIEEPEIRQKVLEEKMKEKKFLLVLDDVWSEQENYMEFLRQLLRLGVPGSKILVTTRSADVARAMHADSTHHLEQLSDDDCWSLFEKHAFGGGSSNADPKINEIGRQIVNECKGVPLAIKAIGDLLWSESNVERWTNILKSDLWDVSLEGTRILPTLILSYKYLPPYLKQCFLYCSIFPKGYVFKKSQLVLLWMAEGFLHKSKNESIEEVGKRCLDGLISRSLLQQQSRKSNSDIVMHDLVHDLANFVSGQFSISIVDGSSKEIVNMTRYLSFCHGRNSYNGSIGADLDRAKHLRTFMALDLPRWWIANKIKLPRAGCLRVISLSGLRFRNKWLDSISKMKLLRYLDLSSSSINRLSNSICLLCNLQTLKLSDCRNLERLPRNMRKLINLYHLEIDETDKLMEMPVKMDSLKYLQTLTKFVVGKHNQEESGSLLIRGGLLHTLKELRIHDCKEFELPMNRRQYPSLKKLFLTNCDSLTSFSLDPFPNVKVIIIDGCRTLKSLEHDHEGESVVSEIRIRRCSSFVSFSKGGLHTPNLERFFLEECDSLRSMPDKMCQFLPSLQFLKIRDCPEVESFPEGGLPSNLKKIEIHGCKRLVANWTGWGLETLPSLSSLKISDKSKDVESFPGKLLLPTTLRHLGIYSFPNLESLDNEGFQHLTALTMLHIERCPKLKYLPEEGFPASLHVLGIRKCDHLLMKELKRKGGKEWLKVARVPATIIGLSLTDVYKEETWGPPVNKIVFKLDVHDDRENRKVIKAVANLPGIESVQIDTKESKLTVIGDRVDPVDVVKHVRKFTHAAELLSLEPA